MLFPDARYERKPGGTIVVDGREVAHTMQCCHCGNHFISRKGSGIRRGYCHCCNKVTCGAGACDPCVPFEKRLDLIERGLYRTK